MKLLEKYLTSFSVLVYHIIISTLKFIFYIYLFNVISLNMQVCNIYCLFKVIFQLFIVHHPRCRWLLNLSQHPCATCLQDSFNICLFFSLRKMRKKERCHMSANATGRASVFSTFSSSAVCQNLMADAPPHFWPKVRFYWVIFLFKDSFLSISWWEFKSLQ